MKYLNILVITAMFFSASNLISEEKSAKYKIGVILPLSGSASSLGNYIKRGVDLAYKLLPKNKAEKIEVFFEDDQFNAVKSISAFNFLKESKKIDALISFGSGVGNALSPITEKTNTVLFSIASDKKVVEDKKYSFLHWVTPEVEAKEMAKELKNRNYQRISIISAEHVGAKALIEEVKKAINAQGLKDRLISEEYFLPDELDYKTYIFKLKALKSDVVVTILFPGALASFAKQTKITRLNADLAGVELFEDENEVKASKGALIGHWYVNADEGSGFFNKLHIDEYSEKSGYGSANGFDSFNLLVEAFLNTDGKNSSIIKYISNLKNYSGAAVGHRNVFFSRLKI